MTDMKGWLERRGKEQQRLYDKYGKALEQEHTGEYVAIGTKGQTILGKRIGEVAQQALDTLGKGNFGVFRVGYPTLTRWLKISS